MEGGGQRKMSVHCRGRVERIHRGFEIWRGKNEERVCVCVCVCVCRVSRVSSHIVVRSIETSCLWSAKASSAHPLALSWVPHQDWLCGCVRCILKMERHTADSRIFRLHREKHFSAVKKDHWNTDYKHWNNLGRMWGLTKLLVLGPDQSVSLFLHSPVFCRVSR